MSAVALAWLLRRSPVMVSIPGTKSLEHLSDNISATKVVTELTGGEVRALTAVENEESATLSTMPARRLDALRRADAGPTDGWCYSCTTVRLKPMTMPAVAAFAVLLAAPSPAKSGPIGTNGKQMSN
jgi:hypothetical protein